MASSNEDAWRRYDAIESRLTASVSERMLDLAALQPGMRVLDLASGRGEPSLRAARRVGSEGRVVGLDLAAPLLAIARESALRDGIDTIEYRAESAETFACHGDESFDVATSRWGLMYMSCPRRALEQTRRALVRHGVFVGAFWAEPARVPWATLPRSVLARHCEVPAIDLDAPGPFRYSDPSRIEHELAAAGFACESMEEVDVAVIEAPTGEGIVAWVRDLNLLPLASALPRDRNVAWANELARELEAFRVGDLVRLGGVSRIVVARSTRER